MLNRAAKVQKVDAKFLIGLADFYAAWAQDRTEKKDQVKTQAVTLLDRAATMKPPEELIQHVADTYNHFGETKKAAKYYLQVLTQESEPSVTARCGA